jgi:hypothetical protein
MNLFLSKNQKGYYVLKKSMWEPGKDGPGATRQRYIAYVGKEPQLTRKKALKICAEKGLKLEDLKRVRGLTIVEDSE